MQTWLLLLDGNKNSLLKIQHIDIINQLKYVEIKSMVLTLPTLYIQFNSSWDKCFQFLGPKVISNYDILIPRWGAIVLLEHQQPCHDSLRFELDNMERERFL